MAPSTVDLSDLDPFAPTAPSRASSSRSVSPHPLGALFPAPPSASARTRSPLPSSSISPGQAIPAAPPSHSPLHPQEVLPGADPLAHLRDPSDWTSAPPAAGPDVAAAPALPSEPAVQAHEQRNARILRDLARGPFAPPTPPIRLTDEPTALPDSPARVPATAAGSSSAAVPIPGASSSSSSSTQDLPLPATSPSTALHRRPSRSQGLSPPRRLSTLMDSSATSFPHGPSSPPAESSVLSDPFHAASTVAGAAWRRIRTASSGAGELLEQAMDGGWTHPPRAGERRTSGGGSGEWGEFQDGPTPLAASPTPSPPSARVRVGFPEAQPSSSRTEDEDGPGSRTGPTVGGGLGTLGRAASLPVSAAAAAVAGSSLSTSLSSLFGSAGRPPVADRQQDPKGPRRSPPSPVRAATTSANGNGWGASGGGFDPTAQPIKLVGLRPGVQRVLEEDVAEGIRPSLPPRLRLSPKWTLLYSLDQHGVSLTTLFSNLARGLATRDGGFVLVVKTGQGDLCGAYVSEALRDGARETKGATRWLGDGSWAAPGSHVCIRADGTPSTLPSAHGAAPRQLSLASPALPPSDFRIGSSVQTYKPTFRNTYYAYATSAPSPVFASPFGSATTSSSRGGGGGSGGGAGAGGGGGGSEAFLAFGGGEDGRFGLYLDGLFERGWTGRSETFGNEPLVGGPSPRTTPTDGSERPDDDNDNDAERDGAKFEMVGLECWAVGS